MHVGFIGLGHMGNAMAGCLMGAGHSLLVYNRTPARTDELEKKGARVARSPEEAARGAEVVITMVADDQALTDVMLGRNGVLAGLSRGAVHVAMSTISPATSRWLHRAHGDVGQGYVAAPVLGRPEAAERGELVVVAAGASSSVARCRPLFDALGKSTHVVGDAPEMANVAKLGINFFLATILEAFGEAYALVEHFGITDQVFLEVLDELFASPVIEAYGRRIAKGELTPGFHLRLGLKDVGLALDAGASVAVPMPIASVVRDRFVAAVARGLQEQDWSAVALVAKPAA